MTSDLQVPPCETGGCRGLGGRLVVSLFFGIFLLVGLGFTAMIVVEGVRELATWRWRAVPCRIEASAVERTDDDGSPYRVVVRYRYRVDGLDLTGDRIRRSDAGYDGWDAAARVAERFPAGTVGRCWTDPEQPDSAVLERSLPWFLAVLPLPLIFVAVGGIGLIATWRSARKAESSQPLSAKAVRRQVNGRRAAVVVGALVLAGGAAGCWFLLVRPAMLLLDAQTWVETDCTVIASRVRSHQSDDGSTYSVDILFEYRIDGAPYRSSRHRFIGGSSSGSAAKREVVDRYPAGSHRTCWVDPDNPRRAVLDRSFHPIYLLGLFPLAAMVGGALVLGYGLRRPADATTAAAPAAPVERTGAPGRKALGMALMMLFWNGIVAVFVGVAVNGWRHGSPDWFLTLFLIPFVVVGLLLVVGFVQALLAIANPRVVLRLAPAAPRLGDTLTLEWEVRGRSDRLASLEIVLEGRERATFSRGTDSVTEHQVFSRQVVASSTGFGTARGGASVWLPEDSMHSFSAPHNGVEWRLLVKGDIPRWPDVADEHALEVHPLDPSRLVDPRVKR